MLKRLQLNKVYHVKDYDTLVKERSKYWISSIFPDFLHKRLKFIANKQIYIQSDNGIRINVVSYDKHVHAYIFNNSNGYIIYPHEVVEFDQVIPNIF